MTDSSLSPAPDGEGAEDRNRRKKREYMREYSRRPEIRERDKCRDRTVERKAYRAANKDRINAHNRRWLAENRNVILDRRKVAYLRNRKVELVRAARVRARNLGLPFSITADSLEWPELCPVFGIPLNYDIVGKTDRSPSLDRVVPSNGYVQGNVVVVSLRANRMKNTASLQELRQLLGYVEKYSQ